MKKFKKNVASFIIATTMLAGIMPAMPAFAAGTTVFEDNFNDGYGRNWSTSYGGRVAEDDEGTGAVQLARPDATNGALSHITHTFDEALTGKRYMVSYQFKPDNKIAHYVELIDSENKTYTIGAVDYGVADSGDIWVFIAGRNSNDKNTKMAFIDASKWYQADVILDFSGTVTTAETILKEVGGNVVAHRDAVPVNQDNLGYALKDIKSVKFNCIKVNNLTGPIFDDFKIEKLPESLKLTETSITLKDVDGKSSSLQAAAAQTNKVLIDFGTAMDESTLNNTNIYLVDAATSNKLAYTPSVSGNVYTLNLMNTLEAGKTYNLYVTKDVKALDGGTLPQDASFSFTTTVLPFYSCDFTTGWPESNGVTIAAGAGADGTSVWVLNRWGWNGGNSYGKYTFPAAGTDKRYMLSYQTISYAGFTSYFEIYGSDGKTYVLGYFGSDGTFSAGRHGSDKGAGIATLTPGTWYNVEVILDLSGDITTAETTVKSLDGTVVAHREAVPVNKFNTGFGLNDLHDMRLFCSGSEKNASGAAFDNIVIKTIPEAPSISEANVKLYDGAGTEQSFTAASTLTNKIEIAFGPAMNASTLNNSNIYLVDRATSAKIPYVSTIVGNTYTMTLTSALEPEKTYDLYVTKNVKTLAGGANDADKVLSFTTVASSIVPDTKYILNENLNGTVKDWYVQNASLVEVTTGDKAYAIVPEGATTASGNIQHGLTIGTTGKYKLSYRVKPGENANTYLSLHSSDKQWYAVGWFGANSTFSVGRTDNRTLAANMKTNLDWDSWYKVESVINLTDGWVQTTLFDNAGTQLAQTEELAYKAYNGGFGLSDICNIRMLCDVDLTSYSPALYDDITIEEIFDDPTVSTGSIKLFNVNGTEETNYQSVNPLLSRVIIDLGTAIDTDTITAENIKIVDSQGNAVANVLSYENKIATMSIAQTLKGNEKYTLVISKNVKNINGVALADDIKIDFVTAKAQLSANIDKVTVGNTEINSLSNLTQGTNATIEIAYENSTGADGNVYVIVSYYSGNKLVKADYIKKTVAANITSETQTVSHQIASLDGVDTLKIMTWDGFDTMHPLSACKVIK